MALAWGCLYPCLWEDIPVKWPQETKRDIYSREVVFAEVLPYNGNIGSKEEMFYEKKIAGFKPGVRIDFFSGRLRE